MPFEWHPDDPPPRIEEHSKTKLQVLRNYLKAYFDTLNNNPAREEFKIDLVDGFAGGGIFQSNGEIVAGSPLIMLEESEAARKRLNENRSKLLRFDCKYYFYDVKKAHTDHLKKALDDRGYDITDEKFVIQNCAFADALEGTIEEINRRQPKAGRAIFLLDQTGYSQVPLSQAAQIFRKLPNAEIILTFAVDALINFLNLNPTFIKLVSPIELTKEQIINLIAMKKGEGGQALAQRALRQHIRTAIGATYDTPFFIRPEQSHRALWFLHLSRHPTARDVMIQRHWELENKFVHYGPGDIDILGWDALNSGTLDLFNFSELDAEQLQNQLPDSLVRKLYTLASDHPITVNEFRHVIANQTAARFIDIDRAIATLHRENEIQIVTPDNIPRSSTYQHLKPTDVITIPTQPMFPGLSRLAK